MRSRRHTARHNISEVFAMPFRDASISPSSFLIWDIKTLPLLVLMFAFDFYAFELLEDAVYLHLPLQTLIVSQLSVDLFYWCPYTTAVLFCPCFPFVNKCFEFFLFPSRVSELRAQRLLPYRALSIVMERTSCGNLAHMFKPCTSSQREREERKQYRVRARHIDAAS